MNGERSYHGPLVVLTPEQVTRVFHWTHADPVPDETTLALRAQCEVALNARPNPTKGTAP